MARGNGTTVSGGLFSDEVKKQVWEKGNEIVGFSKDVWRSDKCGAFMQWIEYGNRSSSSGWEIDHFNPVSNGGIDNSPNLEPLNWKNNASKADKYPWVWPIGNGSRLLTIRYSIASSDPLVIGLTYNTRFSNSSFNSLFF